MRAISHGGKTLESAEIRVGNGIQGEVGLKGSSSLFSIPTKQNIIIYKITKHHSKKRRREK